MARTPISPLSALGLVTLALVACESEGTAEPAPTAPASTDPSHGPKAAPEKPAPSSERQRHERACSDGEAQACFQLAEMLDRGEGGPIEPERARAMYQEACAGGSLEACDALGH